MSRRPVERAALRACAGWAVLALAACGPAARAGAGTPLLVHSVAYVQQDGQSRLFIADFDRGRVVVLDANTNRVVSVIRDLPTAQEILAVPELHRIYVAEPGVYEIAAIDTRTYAVIARVPGGRYPAGMAWDPVHRKLYASDVIDEAETVIDTAKNVRIATIPLGGAAGGSQFARSENLIYVNVASANELVAIDPVVDAVVARYPIPGCAGNGDLLVDDVRRLASITCGGNARRVTFDLRTHRVRDTRSAHFAGEPKRHVRRAQLHAAAPAEAQKVRFDPVAEDDAAVAHLRRHRDDAVVYHRGRELRSEARRRKCFTHQNREAMRARVEVEL
jgi:YVTN family beta-propeller protein